MDKLTGHGHPSNHFPGEVGQHYEDLDTGDIYECRIASKYSPTHGWPVGGYLWELRAKGEDIQDGLLGGSSVTSWNDLTDKPFGESIERIIKLEETTLASGGWLNNGNCSAGVTNIVVVDGVEYECIPETSAEWGNAHIKDTSKEDTGEPFYFNSGIIRFADGGTHTFAIYQEKKNVKTIEEKFIPDTIARADHTHSWSDLGETTTTTVYSDLGEVRPTMSGDYYMVYIPDPKPLVENRTYIVVLDGVEYRCTAGKRSLGHFTDDGAKMFVYGEYEYPFAVWVDEAAGTATLNFPSAAPRTVTIYEVNTEYYIIPKNYLPKAAAIADVSAAPTADEFNALLAALRNAGLMATE